MNDNPKNTFRSSRREFLSASAVAGVGLAAASVSTHQAQAKAAEKPKTMTESEIAALPRVKQKLVPPPFVPEHDQVAKGGPKVVEVRMETIEKKMVIDDEGTEVWALTFGGSVPGPLIVCHQNDFVELTMVNPKSSVMEHNIDFHASTGALGGGGLTHISPGEEVVLRFQATKAGTFVYHCAPGGTMIPYHTTHGMSGAIMVLPRDGLKDKDGNPIKYDRAYYIGEQDYYIPKGKDGEYKKYESPGDNYDDWLQVASTLTPSHIVFNGAVGSMLGDKALKAKVGETCLFVHTVCNTDTRPHIIGGHGDYVWPTGSFTDDPQTGLETWFIAGGAAGAAIYKFLQPGVYAYVNHNLIQAVVKGASGHIKVDGEWNNTLMKQVKKPTEF